MPGDVTLAKSAQCVQSSGVLVTKDAEKLLRAHDRIIGQLLEAFLQGKLVALRRFVDQARLATQLLKLPIEGQQVIHKGNPVFYLRNGGCDFCKQLILVESFLGEYRTSNALPQCVHLSQKYWAIQGLGEPHKVVLLNPTALKDFASHSQYHVREGRRIYTYSLLLSELY